MIIKDLSVGFAKHDLKLVFKQIDISEPDRLLEFLDVLHVTDQTAKEGFITKTFTKKTAQNWCFLNGFFTPSLTCLQINRIWRGSPIEEVE